MFSSPADRQRAASQYVRDSISRARDGLRTQGEMRHANLSQSKMQEIAASYYAVQERRAKAQARDAGGRFKTKEKASEELEAERALIRERHAQRHAAKEVTFEAPEAAATAASTDGSPGASTARPKTAAAETPAQPPSEPPATSRGENGDQPPREKASHD